jgi:hypothetical protein
MGFIITEPYSYYNDEEREKQKRDLWPTQNSNNNMAKGGREKKICFLIERDEQLTSSDAQIPSAAVAAL